MSMSTGLDVLDRRLQGGIRPGTVIALTAPPDTQSELLLHALASARDTLYLSTTAPECEIRDRFGARDDAPALTVERVEPDELLDDPSAVFERVAPGSNLILDVTDGVEGADRTEYLALLDELKAVLSETGSVALLHCMDTDDAPSRRSLTLKRADLVWRLYLAVTTLSVETRLVVSKFRGGVPLREPLKLHLTDRVEVDTSRDIA